MRKGGNWRSRGGDLRVMGCISALYDTYDIQVWSFTNLSTNRSEFSMITITLIISRIYKESILLTMNIKLGVPK